MKTAQQKLELLKQAALKEINIATKSVRGGHKIIHVNDPILSNLDTENMDDVEHMRYAMAFETLSIITFGQ